MVGDGRFRPETSEGRLVADLAPPAPAVHVHAGAAVCVGVLKGAGNFSALLSGRPVSRSEHFAVYHRRPDKLSTSTDSTSPQAVDRDLLTPCLTLGYVIPKRLAKRAVTRVAIRRQMRGAVARYGPQMATGEWALRLRAPWDPKAFHSAASAALATAVRAELDGLLQAVVARLPR